MKKSAPQIMSPDNPFELDRLIESILLSNDEQTRRGGFTSLMNQFTDVHREKPYRLAHSCLIAAAFAGCRTQEQADAIAERLNGEIEKSLSKQGTDGAPKPKKILDLSMQTENLDITAEQFSALINQPDLPNEFKTILDEYCEVKQ